MDAMLDKTTRGPFWLKDSAIARRVMEAIRCGAEKLNFYTLHAFVVMPNHVHLLITPKVPIPRITNGLKGVTARDANSILHRTGQHFWQDESFDHWVRNSAQFDRIRNYIESNPVSAGLATEQEAWPWSSAAKSNLP
jgi:putative transposase